VDSRVRCCPSYYKSLKGRVIVSVSMMYFEEREKCSDLHFNARVTNDAFFAIKQIRRFTRIQRRVFFRVLVFLELME